MDDLDLLIDEAKRMIARLALAESSCGNAEAGRSDQIRMMRSHVEASITGFPQEDDVIEAIDQARMLLALPK